MGFFFLDIFFGHFLGQLLKAALLVFFLKITRFDCLAVCVSGTPKKFFLYFWPKSNLDNFFAQLFWAFFLPNLLGPYRVL